MKRILLILIVCFASSHSESAERDFSVGAGVGILHSGLGINLAYVGDTDLSYFSTGCDSYSTVAGITCGVGVGYVRTGLFGEKGKHGLGINIGIVGTESKIVNGKKNNSAIYGGGISYIYFFNGISKAGLNLGVGGTISLEGNNDVNAAFQIGYQF
ncbi:hypothetical protein [uncultured Shewanella sp.]|uniref:hypothetical protein n=1 Tax=uncultured Shewanella sp. TaxID=173975 RepID=UPI0026050AB4|nr:hypothetical protein [uncultured Shewanella sp.]